MEVYSYEETHFPKEMMPPLNNSFPVDLTGIINSRRCIKCNTIKFINGKPDKFICKECR